jgi:hypothetical protein
MNADAKLDAALWRQARIAFIRIYVTFDLGDARDRRGDLHS